jgi:hypothetical protein
MSNLDKMETLIEYANSKNVYVTFALDANKTHTFAHSADLGYGFVSIKELLFLLAKLRSMDKPVIWSIDLSSISKLKQQIWFKCLDKIQNGDIIRINYYSNIHDDFVFLVDIIRRYSISNIYIKFYDQISLDIVQFVSDVTKANIYYDANVNFVPLNEFTKHED